MGRQIEDFQGKQVVNYICCGLAGALVLPLSGIVLLFIAGTFLEFFGVQGASGGSGGFEMGLASIFLLLIPGGALSFFLVTFFREVRRRRILQSRHQVGTFRLKFRLVGGMAQSVISCV